jgi:hypothetical protein
VSVRPDMHHVPARQDRDCVHANGRRRRDTVREDGGREVHAARAQSLPLTLVDGHGETWTYRKLSTLENKRKRLHQEKTAEIFIP